MSAEYLALAAAVIAAVIAAVASIVWLEWHVRQFEAAVDRAIAQLHAMTDETEDPK